MLLYQKLLLARFHRVAQLMSAHLNSNNLCLDPLEARRNLCEPALCDVRLLARATFGATLHAHVVPALYTRDAVAQLLSAAPVAHAVRGKLRPHQRVIARATLNLENGLLLLLLPRRWWLHTPINVAVHGMWVPRTVIL